MDDDQQEVRFEFHSMTWKAVRRYCEDRVEYLKEGLLGDLSEKETTRSRGQVKALRDLMELESPPQVVETVLDSEEDADTEY